MGLSSRGNDNLAAPRRNPMFLMLALLLFVSSAFAQTPLKVKMFPGAQSLPVLAAASQGLFAKHGLKVEVLFTANSDEQRNGLAAREFEIAQAAVDNAVAMVELAGKDVVIVTGGDSSMNEFIVQPDVVSFGALKGQTLLVDAPNANRDTLERYIAGFIEGNRWAVAPENRDAAVKILAERLKVSPDAAAHTWQLLSDPKFGLARDGQLDLAGFRNVLALRAEIQGSWGG